MRQKKGFLLLLLVVTLAIGAMIYMAVLDYSYDAPARKRAAEPPVWQQQWRLDRDSSQRRAAERKARKYIEQKPAVKERMLFTGEVAIGSEERGRMELVVTPPDSVKGSWQTTYTHGNTQYTIEASFEGLADPTNISHTEKLFYYTRGEYSFRSKNLASGVERARTDIAYATGWLEADLGSARGEITLTTDDSQSYGVYSTTLTRQ